MKKNKNVIEYEKSTNTYFDEITKEAPLSREEEIELWEKYKNTNDICARNKLVSSNLKFVASIAKQYQGMGLSYGELIAEGNYGLIKAIDRFDGTKGYKLISYAVWWIRQSIIEAIKKRNVMDADDLPLNNINDDIIIDDDTEKTISKEFHFDDEFKKDTIDEEKKMVGYLMNFLNEKEKIVINDYFGLDGSKPKTLEEIGEILGITKERVRQIKSKVLIKFRCVAMSLAEK